MRALAHDTASICSSLREDDVPVHQSRRTVARLGERHDTHSSGKATLAAGLRSQSNILSSRLRSCSPYVSRCRVVADQHSPFIR